MLSPFSACAANCAKCSQAGKCDTCLTGYKLVNSACQGRFQYLEKLSAPFF